MRRFFSESLGLTFLQDKRAGLGVIGAAMFGVLGLVEFAATYNMLIVESKPFETALGPIARFVVLVSLAGVILMLLRRSAQRPTGLHDAEQIPPKKGLVWLLSPDPKSLSAPLEAIEYHRSSLAHVWILATFQYQSFREQYEELTHAVSEMGVDATFHKVDLSEPTAQATYEAVVDIYTQQLPRLIVQNDVVADITGANKPVTAGMALACAFHGWPISYLDKPRDAEGRLLNEPGRHVEIKLKMEVDHS